VPGAAAERFNADSSGASVEVGEVGAFDVWCEDVEKRFAQAVAGGARCRAAGSGEQPVAISACDDAHKDRRIQA